MQAKGKLGAGNRTGALVTFVQNALPGQRVNARVVKCKSKYAECKLEDVLERSPSEQAIPYQEIPGAPYAHLPITDQHAMKEQTALSLPQNRQRGAPRQRVPRVGRFARNWHYRNKMETASRPS